MPLVRNTLDPVPTTREVRVRLVAPVGTWFTRPTGPREVLTYWRPTVGADGVWSVDVPANADYDAVDTWYLVEEPGATHAMVVPVTVGPHELRDITIDMPGGSYCGPVPTAGSTLVALRDVDATGPIGAVLTRTSPTGFSLQPLSTTAAQVQLTAIAAVALSGHRAVTPRPDGTLEYASNAVAAHLHAPLWITQGAVTAGQPATVLAYGALTESSWAWTPGTPLFLGADGLLTQTPPVAPGALFSAQVGTATGATSAFFDRQLSISLA